MSGFITLVTRAVGPDPFFTLSSFTCAVVIACAFASVRCVCDSLCMLRFPELALVQAYSHVYCAICLLVAASLDRSALRCADRGRWREQHLLSSAAFSCCCRSHGRWHIANLLFMSSTLLHLIALLFAVRAGAWKACACVPCAVCSALETACLVPVCCFCLHCCSCLLDSTHGLPCGFILEACYPLTAVLGFARLDSTQELPFGFTLEA